MVLTAAARPWAQPSRRAPAFKGEWGSVGDVALIDEEGFVFIRDRKIDMIISGGVNIYPAEARARLAHARGVRAASF